MSTKSTSVSSAGFPCAEEFPFDLDKCSGSSRATTFARVKVAVVAEFYPSDRDPVLGVWAHRQALAARDAGADVEVLVLHRLVPPQASLRGGFARELAAPLRESRRPARAGLPVTYVPFVPPPRSRGYARWGAWAGPVLARALRSRRFELVHAHN